MLFCSLLNKIIVKASYKVTDVTSELLRISENR